MEADKYIVAIDGKPLSASLKNNIGGKGYNILLLKKYNFKVPKGFILTNEAFKKTLVHNNLFGFIKKTLDELKNISLRKIGDIKKISSSLRERILKVKIPDDLLSAISDKIANMNLKNRGLSIRSSGISEDSEKLSFAGLYDSFINIPEENLIEYIKKCWASQFNTRLLIYRIVNKLPMFEGMGVIIQETICGDASGIMFTSIDETNVSLIESNFGLGISVAKGETSPDRFYINKDTLEIMNKILGSKDVVYRCVDSGVVKTKTDINLKSVFSIDDETIKKITKIGLRLENIFRTPQDVEWTIYGNEIYLLQSRNITATRPKFSQ